MPWSKGGADSVARKLGVTRDNCFKPTIVEGDAKLYDQSVREFFVNLYFSTMSAHLDTHDKDYPLIEMILKFLIRNMINRITQLFGSIWGVVQGGVPSGAFNTSHMDSWIMALYFFLFCVWQIHQAPDLEQEELESYFMLIIRIVVYGDDHFYNKGDGKCADHFSGQRFADFMKKYFSVYIRDLKENIPFCSTPNGDFLRIMGATFLKYQFVLNPDRSPGQADFLPYRESREYIVRAVWGRTPRKRDAIDVMLSLLGHAYSTYASNRCAYDRMHVYYQELARTLGQSNEDLAAAMSSRLTVDDLKKIRQLGMTPEELLQGYPTWETLVEKNIVDPFYQDISKNAQFYSDDVHGFDDIF
jgi:hypothetical protein